MDEKQSGLSSLINRDRRLEADVDSDPQSNIVALAAVVGLVAFLLVESLSSGSFGPLAFLIGFFGTILIVFIVMLVAFLVERRHRDILRCEELLSSILETALQIQSEKIPGHTNLRPLSDASSKKAGRSKSSRAKRRF